MHSSPAFTGLTVRFRLTSPAEPAVFFVCRQALVGGPKSPRDAICATVYLQANSIRMRQDVLSSGSFNSSNDQRLDFGMGDASDAGKAEINWLSGKVETVKLPPVDRIYTIAEGKGIAGLYAKVRLVDLDNWI